MGAAEGSRGSGSPSRRQSRPSARAAHGRNVCRPTVVRSSPPGVLRLHVLRRLAAGRGQGAAQGWLLPSRKRLGQAHPVEIAAAVKQAVDRQRTGKRRPGLKHRADAGTRSVPIPPELVMILREHIEEFGTAADGRLFRTVAGGMIYDHTARWAGARRPDTGASRLADGGPALRSTMQGSGIRRNPFLSHSDLGKRAKIHPAYIPRPATCDGIWLHLAAGKDQVRTGKRSV